MGMHVGFTSAQPGNITIPLVPSSAKADGRTPPARSLSWTPGVRRIGPQDSLRRARGACKGESTFV